MVSIKDIAQVAGVSHTTVSRALREHPGISAETIRQIKQIAAELGYVPSAAARSLKTNRSHIIGVIVQRVADPFFGDVLDGIQDVLHRDQYKLFLSSLGYKSLYETEAVQAFIEQRIDGLLICSAYLSEASCRLIEAAGIPIVVIHNRSDTEFRYSLYHDDIYGGKVVTQHLLELGHQRIAYIANSQGGRVSEERLIGCKQAFNDIGLAFAETYLADAGTNSLDAGEQAAAQLLTLPTPPTAIFCYNDLLAIGAMQAAHRLGLRVPEDCSIAGFDNIAYSAYVRPLLTTFDQPKHYLGMQAATMLLKLLMDQPHESETTILRGRLIVRESTAPLLKGN